MKDPEQVAQEEAVQTAMESEYSSELDVREAQGVIIENAGNDDFDPYW